MTLFCLSNQMFVDIILLNMFLDLILLDELDVFYWSFESFIVDLILLWFHFAPTVSFCFYIILMPKRMHLIQKFVFFKGDSNPIHFSSFEIYFNVLNKISSTPPRLLIFFKSFPTTPPPVAPNLLSFEEFLTPPVYSNTPFY